MSFEHFEHKLGIGIKGVGDTVEEAFGECARGMLDVAIEVRGVSRDKKEVVEVSATDQSQLLVEFLNKILSIKDSKKLIFSDYSIHINQLNGVFHLRAKAAGTVIDSKKHHFKVNLKTAIPSELKVIKQGNKWIVQGVVTV